MNLFLEQWVPFDFSNNALPPDRQQQPDYASKRFSDWTRAPRNWLSYSPSLTDYQSPGNLERSIFRSLSIDARGGSITEDDIEEAFISADQGEVPVLSVTNHDNRDMVPEIEFIWSLVKKIHSKFPDVRIKHMTAQEAALAHKHNKRAQPWELNVKLNGNELLVQSERPIFGAQPFLAFATHTNDYFHDNFACVSEDKWVYVFDDFTIPLEALRKIGVATHDQFGNKASRIIETRS